MLNKSEAELWLIPCCERAFQRLLQTKESMQRKCFFLIYIYFFHKTIQVTWLISAVPYYLFWVMFRRDCICTINTFKCSLNPVCVCLCVCDAEVTWWVICCWNALAIGSYFRSQADQNSRRTLKGNHCISLSITDLFTVLQNHLRFIWVHLRLCHAILKSSHIKY